MYSFAYDGQRGLLWHRQENWTHEHKKWRQGDVLGVLLDLDAGRMKFSLNGAFLFCFQSAGLVVILAARC